MLELHLRQPGFMFRACGSFTKHREMIKEFKETGDLNYIRKNKLDEACFPHDVSYTDSKDLIKRTVSDKVLKEKLH